MVMACDPGASLWGAAEASTADREEDVSGTNPLRRLPVALRVAGDAVASSEPLRSDRSPSCFATELAKTARPPLRVTPSVAPLRRASNCEEAAAGASARRDPVLPSLPLLTGADCVAVPLDCDLTGAALEGAGLLETAGRVL